MKIPKPKPRPRRVAVEDDPDFEFYHPTDPRFEGGRPVRKKLLYQIWLEEQRAEEKKREQAEIEQDTEA